MNNDMNKKKILLVVDDERGFRKVVAARLEKQGYQIYQAGDGKEAFRIARKVRPDLVISDIIMPRMDGNRLLKKLRKAAFGKGIPFIVITAREAMRDYFEAVGATAFFKKPLRLNELTDKIDEILTGRKEQSAAGEKRKKGKRASDQAKQSHITVQEEMMFKNSVFDVGKKTRVRPVSEEEKRPKDPWEGRQRIHPSSERKILIYESESPVAKALVATLCDHHFATEIVLTHKECIEESQRLLPDLILLGSHPGIFNAEAFAIKLRGIASLEKIPIIIYGDVGKEPDQEQARAGNAGFLWNTEGKQLLERIYQLLGTG